MSNVKEKKYEATLVRGETYAIGAYIFLKRKPQIINAELRRKLELSAIDRYTMTGSEGKEVEVKQKFHFKEVAEIAAPSRAKQMAKSKADELEEMLGDGGISFEDEDKSEDKTTDSCDEKEKDEYSIEEDDSGDLTKVAKTKVTSGGGAKRNRR